MLRMRSLLSLTIYNIGSHAKILQHTRSSTADKFQQLMRTQRWTITWHKSSKPNSNALFNVMLFWADNLTAKVPLPEHCSIRTLVAKLTELQNWVLGCHRDHCYSVTSFRRNTMTIKNGKCPLKNKQTKKTNTFLFFNAWKWWTLTQNDH